MSRITLEVEGNSKRESPVKRGTLRRSITSRVEQGGDVGRVGTNLSYARPVHDGSAPHIIRPRNKRALFWSGARHPVKMVKHPGNKGNPFMDRGLQRTDIQGILGDSGAEYFTRLI